MYMNRIVCKMKETQWVLLVTGHVRSTVFGLSASCYAKPIYMCVKINK